MTRTHLGRSRVRENRMLGSVGAKLNGLATRPPPVLESDGVILVDLTSRAWMGPSLGGRRSDQGHLCHRVVGAWSDGWESIRVSRGLRRLYFQSRATSITFSTRCDRSRPGRGERDAEQYSTLTMNHDSYRCMTVVGRHHR